MSAVWSVGILSLKYLAPSNLLSSLFGTSFYIDHMFWSEISSANLFFLWFGLFRRCLIPLRQVCCDSS